MAASCGPDGGDYPLSPILLIDACGTPGRELGGKYVGGVKDCLLDFGLIQKPKQRQVLLTNGAHIDTAFSLGLEPGGSGFSIVSDIPALLKPGLSASITIEADAEGFAPMHARLEIFSDAANFPADSDGVVTVELIAYPHR